MKDYKAYFTAEKIADVLMTTPAEIRAFECSSLTQYGLTGHLNPGSRQENDSTPSIEVSCSVYFNPLSKPSPDLSTYEGLTLDEVNSYERENIDEQKKIYQEIMNLLKQWRIVAALGTTLQMYENYLTCAQLESTHNTWQFDKDYWGGSDDNNSREVISNATYKMFIDRHYCDPQSYSYSKGKNTVEYSFFVRKPVDSSTGVGAIIMDGRKTCVTKEECEKYIEGRKKAYSKYFTEEYMPVPRSCKHFFSVGNMLLPGYCVAQPDDVVPPIYKE